ncbi:multiple sugar transport system substrate-binding protein [Paenibacillus sp. UNCCL117]|uniref:ABC transporter substrate-binding protein n=1 Tax=unclassified Paenibacillus TaxID=185978 RepID=UPI00088A3AF9|nr:MULTISPECIES: extracellular solute-binding protein [unclassified Paenibacillus]SDC27985.1 multiple sugar transport system substrate-binding protein [Paenibacillus sp. cl123]SFW20456.1 multiple sugar transport system substrate-binding protein [Paenibacillus sp. UNCCL117]
MKKTSAILMSSVLVLLAGCGAGNEAASPAGTGGSAAPQNVTLKYYNWDNDVMASTTKSLIDKFQAENPNIKVESISLVPGNSVETLKKLDVTMSSGEQIDVVLFPSIDETLARAAQGVLAPMDEWYTKNNINAEEEYYVNPKYKGKYYATMYQRSNWLVLLNQNALDEAGLKVPELGWTWDDFREYAKKLTKGEGNNKRYGAYFHNWGDYANPILFNERQNPFLKEDGTTQFSDPSMISFFNLRRAMEKEDKSAKTHADIVGAKLAYRTEFFNEKAAMLVTGSWMVADSADTTKYPHNFKVAFAPVPRSSADAELGLTSIGGQYASIANSSKHKEEAYKFIRFITTDTAAKKELSGWKKADDKKTIETTIAANKQLFNTDSLDKALFDKRIHAPAPSEVVAPYAPQLKKVLEDGFGKFILDNISAEEAQKTMVDQANKIIKENK